MNNVFMLQHVYYLDDDYDCEVIKLVGVYSSYDAAARAVSRLKEKPGFHAFPNILDPDDVYGEGFEITDYEMDKDHWTEGYITEEY